MPTVAPAGLRRPAGHHPLDDGGPRGPAAAVPGGGAGRRNGAPVAITFWHAMTAANEDALVKLTNAYNASQAKVRVTLINQGGYEQSIEKYKTVLGRRPPGPRADARVHPPAPGRLGHRRARSSPASTPTDYDLADFLPRATAYYTLRGALQGMPFNVSNPVLYYNRAAFVKAGLDPDDPPTQPRGPAGRQPATRRQRRRQVRPGARPQHRRRRRLVPRAVAGQGRRALRQQRERPGRPGHERAVRRADRRRAPDLPAADGDRRSGHRRRTQHVALPDNLLKLVDPKDAAGMTIHTTAALGSVLNILQGGGYPRHHRRADVGIGPCPAPR